MAQNTTINCAPGEWTLLTDSNITMLTFQNRRGGDVLIAVTATPSPPSTLAAGVIYKAGEGEVGLDLALLQPGVTLGARVYAYAQGEAADVFVSHA